MSLYDAILVGGGPAGLTAALYLCRSGAKIALVEMLSPGGQLLGTEQIENYPGHPKGINGWELAELFSGHLDAYTFDRYADEVSEMVHTSSGISLRVGKQTIQGKTVLICSGASPRKLGLPDEARLTGKGVSYCALCDGNFFRNQDIAVIGGGNSALEEALYLSRIVKKLYLIHRRQQFRAASVYIEKVQASPCIELVLDTVVDGLIGESALTGLDLRNVKSGEISRIDVEGLFVFTGYQPRNTFLPATLALDAHGFVLTDPEMCTNLPGVFAAGDIRSKQCRQVVTAVGDGATAATAALSYLEQMGA